jgi:uncharacterized membrane protein YccC
MTDTIPPVADQPSLLARVWTIKTRAAALQALRVMIACSVTYVIFLMMGLKQGYWAIFTVLIVMQGSVGATAGAAVDRLVATVAGAILGGGAVLVTPHDPVATGISLVVVVGILSFATARWPRLRGAGLTAAIVMLTRAPNMPVSNFVVDRILEITLGGIIGVLASRLILPAQSGNVMIERFRSVLDVMAQMLRAQADAIGQGEAVFSVDASIALRKSLVAAEAMLADARRERTMLLTRYDVPEAVPRTLWRIRNGVVQIGRFLETPLPDAVVALVGGPAAQMLHAQADGAQACIAALGEGRAVEIDHAGADAFEAAFAALEHSDIGKSITFDEIGRLFGLAFTLRRMRQDFDDLAERIGEMAES